MSLRMNAYSAPAAKSPSVFVNRPSSSKRFQRPPQRRCTGIRASSGNYEKAELEAIARDILEKENALKNAFQPGQAMPTVPPHLLLALMVGEHTITNLMLERMSMITCVALI